MGNKIEHPSVELPPEKLVMITGGNTGIGYETAKSIAEMGARVFIACRSEDKAKAAINRMQKEYHDEIQKRRHAKTFPSTSEEVEGKPLIVEYIKVDLASLQSTMDFIQETKERMQYLNVLVCNAGIAFVKQEYTDDNYESQFQVNYLSHLLIMLHFMPLLRAGAPDSRIVLLSSVTHSDGKLDLENIQGRKSYGRYTAYASSKAYMVMAAHFIARRLEGTGVSTFSVDPGNVDTDIFRNSSDWKLLSLFTGAYKIMGIMRTAKQGAATSVVAAVDPSLRGKTAVFIKNCRPANPSSFCCDGKKQETLWSYSLGCLIQFISNDVLKEAFPSASPDLLIIPKDTRTDKEKVTDGLGKKEESSDNKETGEQSNGGKSSLGLKQDEKRTDIGLSSGAAEKGPWKLKASQNSSAAIAEDRMPEGAIKDVEKEFEKPIEEHPEKESPSAEVGLLTKEAKTEETSRQESEENTSKDSSPEHVEEPGQESSGGTPPETDHTYKGVKADAEVPTESLKSSKKPSGQESGAKGKLYYASKEGTAGAASSEIEQVEGQPEREPPTEAASKIDQAAEAKKAYAKVPTESTQISREPSGHDAEKLGLMDDAANEETGIFTTSDSKQMEEQPEGEVSAKASSKIGKTSEDLKPDKEAPAESRETIIKKTSSQKSEERDVKDDASTAGEVSSASKQVEKQPQMEPLAEGTPECDETSTEPKAEHEDMAYEVQEYTRDAQPLGPKTSTVGKGLSENRMQEGPTKDTAAAEDSSGMPDAETPTEKLEKGSVQLSTFTSEKTVLTEEDVPVEV